MPLTLHQLEQIDDVLAGAPDGALAMAALRQRLPGLRVTECDASDVDCETPFRGYGAFDLHLVDGRDHCWRLTIDPDVATGVMIAARRTAR